MIKRGDITSLTPQPGREKGKRAQDDPVRAEEPSTEEEADSLEQGAFSRVVEATSRQAPAEKTATEVKRPRKL